jgi:hypothetical protein
MTGNELDKPASHPDTWPGVVSRLLELGSESWDKLLRVSILLALLGILAWFLTSVR